MRHGERAIVLAVHTCEAAVNHRAAKLSAFFIIDVSVKCGREVLVVQRLPYFSTLAFASCEVP